MKNMTIPNAHGTVVASGLKKPESVKPAIPPTMTRTGKIVTAMRALRV